MRLVLLTFFIVLLSNNRSTCTADDHEHTASTTATVTAPKIFFDKSPRIVEYQLKRLDNQRLLLVERKSDDPKYVPVYEAILSRPGMSPQYREESIEALTKLKQANVVALLLDSLGKIDPAKREEQRNSRDLATMLLKLPIAELEDGSDLLVAATDSDSEFIRAVGYAGLLTAGKSKEAIDRVNPNTDKVADLLRGIPLVRRQETRNSLREFVVSTIVSSDSSTNRSLAIDAVRSISANSSETFDLVAPMVDDENLRPSAVRTLLAVSDQDRNANSAAQVLSSLVDYAESTPVAERTSRLFSDAMQLADGLMRHVPDAKASEYRDRLSEVSVRLVRIRTVEEEMRYDVPYFAVEAGRPVQVLLENHDIMPHNLVLTMPGALKEVANLGLQVGPSGASGLPYVPDSEQVLHASEMVAANAETRLTFTAPTEPGEYPYVCTFPQHWYRMYGVMVVVKDLNQWSKNPVEPANPIGSNRRFVQAWTVDDFKGEVESGVRGRSPQIGKKIFAEASCVGCHKFAGEGGLIGPELTDVLTRYKGDRTSVLREIIDPSHKIDAKYVMQRILTVDGRTITGILVKEDDDNVMLLSSPEAKEPAVVPQDDIEAMVPSSVSMMPKALMDQYTKDEIFELLAYLESEGK